MIGEKAMPFETGLLDILIRLHVISAEDALALEKAFYDSDVDQLDDFLLSEGIVDEENLLQALSEFRCLRFRFFTKFVKNGSISIHRSIIGLQFG